MIPTITEFEQIAHEFKLKPEQYVTSALLRDWASRNRNSKFVPEFLLQEWGFEVQSSL